MDLKASMDPASLICLGRLLHKKRGHERQMLSYRLIFRWMNNQQTSISGAEGACSGDYKCVSKTYPRTLHFLFNKKMLVNQNNFTICIKT